MVKVDVNIYPIITIKKDTELYSGGKDSCNKCPHTYKYQGQGGKISDGKIIYLTNNLNTAEGYAQINTKNGYVKKFRVYRDLELYDISEDFEHMDYDELNNNICDNTNLKIRNGYYLDWTYGLKINNFNKVFEIAICNAPDYLEYIESKKCTSIKCEKDFECNKNNKETKEIMNKLNKGNNNCVSGGYKKTKTKTKTNTKRIRKIKKSNKRVKKINKKTNKKNKEQIKNKLLF
jgi:hypothetical protein